MRGPATLALAAVLLLAASPARAAVLGFGCISGNLAGDCAIGEAQLAVDATDAGGGQVLFSFWNSGPAASSITDVYFDDGSLLGISSIVDDPPDVDFGLGATPGEMPAANNCGFATTVAPGQFFSSDSENPPPQKGVNPGEFVDIVFALQGAQTFADVIAELAGGDLMIGIHVQGFDIGTSETFINDPVTAVSLSSFGATAASGQVTLDWRTGSESNTAGFNLYRSTSANGLRVKVNEQLIAAQNSGASGSSYSAVDRPGYGVYYYWLEDVSYTGQSTLHNPILVQVRALVQRPQYRPALPGTYR